MSSTAHNIKTATKPDPGVFKHQGRHWSFPKKNNASGTMPPAAQHVFKGDNDDLDGHLYDVGVNNQAELFTSTQKM